MEPEDDAYTGDGAQPDDADPDGLWQLQLTYGRTESLTWHSSFAVQQKLELALLQQRAITRQLLHEATAAGQDQTRRSVQRTLYEARIDQLAVHNARRVVQATADGWGHSDDMGQQIITVEISLIESDPEIWREFQIPSAVSLSSLHDVIQDVMGWYDSHLYKFLDTNSRVFSDPTFELEGVRDSRKVALSTLLRRPGDVLEYEYDFGDCWEHRLTATAISRGTLQHAVCLDGEGQCPPEDVGGVTGYWGFLDKITDPAHPEHQDMIDWSGGCFDPDDFSIESVNAALAHRKLSPRLR